MKVARPVLRGAGRSNAPGLPDTPGTTSAGAVLVASGLYLIAYWAPALNSGQANQALASSTSPLTSALSTFVQAHTTQIAAVAIVAVLAALHSTGPKGGNREGSA